jgi:hypothetical protein
MKATSISFEQRYSDDSGVEFAVRLRPGRGDPYPQIEFERIDTAAFPADKIDWLIGCLERIRDELDDSARADTGESAALAAKTQGGMTC